MMRLRSVMGVGLAGLVVVASYPPSGVRYVNDRYRFRMVVDVANNRYSVWYRLLNQPEQVLASNHAFRRAATTLDFWMARVDDVSPSPSLSVCNVKVQP